MARGTATGIIGTLTLLSCWTVQAGAQQSSLLARAGTAARSAAVTPAQLSVVWRVDGPAAGATEFIRQRNAFSPDGTVIGITHPSRAVRLLDAADGSLVDRIDPVSAQRVSYSMAIANTGRIAVGRPGSMEVYDVSAGAPIAVLPCAAASCLPTSLAFSPDGSMLGFHEVMPFTEPRRKLGSVRVVDLKFDTPTRMKASTGLRQLSFSSEREASAPEGEQRHGFRIWHTSDWELPQSMLGGGWTVGSVPSESADEPETLVAVYRSGSSVVMRDFSTDRLLWAAPLIRPQFARADSAATRSEIDRIEIAPDGTFLIGYESPAASDPAGTMAGAIVVRRAVDGAIVEAYDVPGVSDLAIAPDSKTFVYSTGADLTHTVLVRVPAL